MNRGLAASILEALVVLGTLLVVFLFIALVVCGLLAAIRFLIGW